MLPRETRERAERRTRAPGRRMREPRLEIERRADGQLWATRGARSAPVRPRACFPWSEPARYVSLRDFDDEEVAFVRDVRELEPSAREALEGALAEAGFVLDIESIDEIEEEVEIRAWRVRTSRGARSFQTPRDEWPREAPGGGILIRDVSGDLFRVRDAAALDERSRRLLWAFVD
jgi:hypothetical protein